MVSLNQAGFNLRESEHLPRNILHSQRTEIISSALSPRGSERIFWYSQHLRIAEFGSPHFPNTKVETGHLLYPVSVRDTAKSGIGCFNRHLTHLAQSIISNAGDSQPNVKVSSPPTWAVRVGAAIVVRARESRVLGEGPQSAGTFRANVTG
jgi:hypothetical protein